MSGLRPEVHPDREAMGRAAASVAAALIRRAAQRRERVRVVFAAAPSQAELLAHLAAEDLPWHRIDAFHMDEYVGLAPEHPARFGNWLRRHLFDRVPLGSVHLMRPEDGRPDDYARRLAAAPVDLVCLGIGTNGHIAFNDPPVADFADPLPVKVVELDPVCRQQQVDDGCFATLADVPTHAWTLTVPRLLDADALVCVVPGPAKAAAVAAAVDGPVGPACPASALRNHPDVRMFVDAAAAARLGG